MYFAIGWPKHLDTASFGDQPIRQICCDRVKILFAILTDDALAIWYTKPCVPIVSIRRTATSLQQRGPNQLVEWKPDSNALVVATSDGTLLVYRVAVAAEGQSIYNQIDPPTQNLKRDSAELFVKEAIPSLRLQLIVEQPLYVPVTCITCVNVTQMMVATRSERILRIRWDGQEERDFSLDLKRIPFSINQQVSYAVPILEANTYVVSCDYSPLVGGFAVVLNDGRAAYLTAGNLRFDPNQVQGIWAQGVEDATCASVNHKYRLIAFGRRNAQAIVYTVDDVTGGLEVSHSLELSAKDYTGAPGAVRELRWTPDGCAVAVSWEKGGISLWSTFGTMLMCSLGWDYGLSVDLAVCNPLDVYSMDWSTEGYQLLMLRRTTTAAATDGATPTTMGVVRSALVQLDLVKSTLTVNPCQSSNAHLFLQGDDKLYVNPGDTLQRVYHNCNVAAQAISLLQPGRDEAVDVYGTADGGGVGGEAGAGSMFSQSYNICTDKYVKGEAAVPPAELAGLEEYEVSSSLQVSSMLTESKHWIVVQLPIAYMATNWPIRYSAIDATGLHLAAAGRTGVAVYSMLTRKWKLFGNERQEKDFLVTGGLLWWAEFLVMGCYSLEQQTDELRLYPRDAKLDNRFGRVVPMAAQVMLINLFEDQLIAFTADGFVTIFRCVRTPAAPGDPAAAVDLVRQHAYDIRGLCVHPACIVSVTLTTLKNDGTAVAARASQGNVLQQQQQEATVSQPETIILNVSGRILMVNRETNGSASAGVQEQLTSTCLASCVECLWVSTSRKTHLRESLWLWCGGHGMRVWLPVFPRGDRASGHGRHTFMSKRIMLSFQLRVYPLAILFEDAIILGAENDTTLYTSDAASAFSVPFCFLKKTSQVFLHQILRQLIRRNLGYNAWEIAGSCTRLPYFPHSLELLLHEVLEEEATSKEPIPDALLPSVLEFIQEFPVYLQTVVQCARKTEIALWPYLFASAGKPKELFQQCLARDQLETAASYLIILQNLEPSSVSRQYATILLETALEQRKWELAKDLVRFLRAIDPNDVESPRNSFVMGAKLGHTHHHHAHHHPPAGGPNAEELSLILGSTMSRGRSFSTTNAPGNVSGKDALSSAAAATGSTEVAAMSPASAAGSSGSAGVQRRKKISVQHLQQQHQSPTTTDAKSPGDAKAHNSAEEFFIEVILQRHARKLLQEKRLEALGYMSAALDFHLVGWLARERERAARVEDFVQTLKQLHDDWQWPKPNLDLKLPPAATHHGQQRRSSELSNSTVTTAQDASPSYSMQSLRIDQQHVSGAGNDSGYTSLPTAAQLSGSAGLTPDVGVAFGGGGPALYNPDLSTAVLQTMSAKFGDLCRISEEGGDGGGKSNSERRAAHLSPLVLPSSPIESVANLVHPAAADTASIASETQSLWPDDASVAGLTDTDLAHAQNFAASGSSSRRTSRRAPIAAKLQIKVRYLLQLFTEAGCLDLALLLSVLLLDAASVGRITSAAVRGGSLAICRQLRNGLKDMTRWSFAECLGYRPFMLQLQPQVGLLDQFVLQQESIPMMPATAGGADSSNLYGLGQAFGVSPLVDQQQRHLQTDVTDARTPVHLQHAQHQVQHHHLGASVGATGQPMTPKAMATVASGRRSLDEQGALMTAAASERGQYFEHHSTTETQHTMTTTATAASAVTSAAATATHGENDAHEEVAEENGRCAIM